MRLTSSSGRAQLCSADVLIDIAEASDGRFPSSMNELLVRADELRDWAQRYPEADKDLLSIDPPCPSRDRSLPLVSTIGRTQRKPGSISRTNPWSSPNSPAPSWRTL